MFVNDFRQFVLNFANKYCLQLIENMVQLSSNKSLSNNNLKGDIL